MEKYILQMNAQERVSLIKLLSAHETDKNDEKNFKELKKKLMIAVPISRF